MNAINKERSCMAVLLIIAAGLIVALAVMPFQYEPKMKTAQTTDEHIDIECIKLRVWNYIQQVGVQHPHIVYAQFVIETGAGTSRLFSEQNNCFGMMKPAQRPYFGNNGTIYASYEHWKHSVHDYALWQAIYCYNLSEAEYFDYLGRNYATDTTYVRKLKEIIK